MDNKETWENITNKNHKPSKTYGLNSSTTISHLSVHDVRRNEQGLHEPPQIFLTIATYDCEFALLESQLATGKMTSDPQFKQLLRVKTNYPMIHCQLEYHFNSSKSKDYLIGYVIDMYSNIYTINFTRNMELSGLALHNHPAQYTTIYRNYFIGNVDNLYLETPLFIKKFSDGIASVNLKGKIMFIDTNQSKSWINSYQDHRAESIDLGNNVLAATSNATKCKYDSVIVVATHNMKVPFVFVNCNSLSDFQNQKSFQTKYEWIEDSVQITYCSIDCKTSMVAISTVTQNIELFQIIPNGSNFYLKKKFGFFMGANLNQVQFNIDLNIQSLHGSRGMLIVVSCKEYLIFDIQSRMVRKRGKGSAISMMRWGGIIDRNDNFLSFYIVKGYNHINEAQSKLGKPNVHFKTTDLIKKDKT